MQKKILIVEDNADFAESLKLVLDARSCNFMVVGNGSDALQQTANENFDICLLDYKLPDMNGFECYIQLKEILPASTRYILMTGSREVHLLERLKTEPKLSLLLKPFKLRDFLLLINSHP